MKRVALIPSYEPDNYLIKVVKDVKNSDFDVVVVNDGSGKKYNSLFKECEKYSKVISYEQNMGKGYALKKGLKYIKENYKECIIVTVDSDGQHTASDAIKVCKEVEKRKNTIVLGKRIRDENVPLRSRLGNSITRFIFKLVSKKDIYDTQTGLRAFRSNLIDYMLNIKKDRFEYEMNVLLNCNDNNIDIIEVPIKTIYINKNESSHFDTVKDSFRIYREIIKYSSKSIISFIIDYVLFGIITFFTNIVNSNIIARLISKTFYFTFHRKKTNKKCKDILVDYIILSFYILLFDTIILCILVSKGLNIYLAKLLTEISLFIINYLVQKE